MPIWLRNFTSNQISEHNRQAQEKMDEASSQNSNKQTAIGADGKINPAAFKKPTSSSYK